MNQMIRKFEKFVFDYFKFFKYYNDDQKVNKKIKNEIIINKILTKKHDVFKNEKIARRIVVINHSIFAIKHESSTQKI